MGISNPLISVIVPFRDREAYIQRALSSFSQILYRPLEMIFVDNCSSDASRQFVEQFITKVKFSANFSAQLLEEPRTGACAARNKGLRAAQGEFVYFFDDDDEMSPEFLVDALPYLRNNDVIAAPSLMIFPNGVQKVRYSSFSNSPRDQILTGMLSTQSMIIRKSTLLQLGGWNEQLPKWNDWELGARLLKARLNVVWLRKPYHRIYQHPDSLTGSSIAATYPLLLPALTAVESLPLSKSERRALAARKMIVANELFKAGNVTVSREIENDCISAYHSLYLLKLYLRLIARGAWLFYRIVWK